jgi:hypothetical protein
MHAISALPTVCFSWRRSLLRSQLEPCYSYSCTAGGGLLVSGANALDRERSRNRYFLLAGLLFSSLSEFSNHDHLLHGVVVIGG